VSSVAWGEPMDAWRGAERVRTIIRRGILSFLDLVNLSCAKSGTTWSQPSGRARSGVLEAHGACDEWEPGGMSRSAPARRCVRARLSADPCARGLVHRSAKGSPDGGPGVDEPSHGVWWTLEFGTGFPEKGHGEAWAAMSWCLGGLALWCNLAGWHLFAGRRCLVVSPITAGVH
jgi:hypothetical protein